MSTLTYQITFWIMKRNVLSGLLEFRILSFNMMVNHWLKLIEFLLQNKYKKQNKKAFYPNTKTRWFLTFFSFNTCNLCEGGGPNDRQTDRQKNGQHQSDMPPFFEAGA